MDLNLGGFITILFVIFAIAWGFWLIFKRDLLDVNLTKMISYFLGVILTLIIVSWITSEFLPWWTLRLVNNTLSSEEIEDLQDAGQALWDEAIRGTPAITTPIVPGPSPTVSPLSAAPRPDSNAGASSAPAGGETTYTVQAGDTLYRISRNHNTTVDAIKERNGLNSNLISPGQQLIIP